MEHQDFKIYFTPSVPLLLSILEPLHVSPYILSFVFQYRNTIIDFVKKIIRTV